MRLLKCVMLQQSLPQTANLDPDNRIDCRVVSRWITGKYLQTYRQFTQSFTTVEKPVPNEMLKQISRTPGTPEKRPVQYLLKGRPNMLFEITGKHRFS